MVCFRNKTGLIVRLGGEVHPFWAGIEKPLWLVAADGMIGA